VELPYVPRTFVEAGRGRGGDVEIIPGSPGARVYWDLVGCYKDGTRRMRYAPTFSDTRHDCADHLRAFIEQGNRSVLSDLGVDVARRRLAGHRSVSRASLPPEFGDDPMVWLSVSALADCRVLNKKFGTSTNTETVEAALRFVREWDDFDRHVVVDDERDGVEDLCGREPGGAIRDVERSRDGGCGASTSTWPKAFCCAARARCWSESSCCNGFSSNGGRGGWARASRRAIRDRTRR
jgi:hypothetical protein